MDMGKIEKLVRVISAIFFLVFSFGMSAFGELAPPPTTQVTAAAAASSEASNVEGQVSQGLPKPGNVTVNFKDVDIKTVLLYLSEVSGVDIIPSPGVDAQVTMRLRDKPWEVALDIVTRNYGYVYSREGDIIRVIPKSQLQSEEPITTVISLNHIIRDIELVKSGTATSLEETIEIAEQKETLEQLMAAIDSILNTEAGEKATYVSGANAVVVTAIPARINAIKEMVAQLDKKTPQILLDCKVLKIELTKDERFGVDWNTVISVAGAKRPTTLPFTNRGKVPFLKGDQQSYYYPIMGPPTSNANVTDFPYLANTAFNALTGVLSDDALFSYGTLDFSTFTATLSLLDERGDTETLSSPRITTLNNQKATIKVVDKIMLQKTEETTQTAGIVTVEFETEKEAREVGVKLTILPHVNNDEEITVNLMPEVSSNSGFDSQTVGTGQTATMALTFNSREANTRVRVRDGETIFIGGLISEETAKTENKIPLIGDILGKVPILGNLVKYERDNVTRTEIIFFVTVHLLKEKLDSVRYSKSTSQYEKYYPEKKKEIIDFGKEGMEKIEPAIKVGELKSKKEEVVEVPVSLGANNKKINKPFLDFRKKKNKMGTVPN